MAILDFFFFFIFPVSSFSLASCTWILYPFGQEVFRNSTALVKFGSTTDSEN